MILSFWDKMGRNEIGKFPSVRRMVFEGMVTILWRRMADVSLRPVIENPVSVSAKIKSDASFATAAWLEMALLVF